MRILLVDQPNGIVPKEGRVISRLLDPLVAPIPVHDPMCLVLEMIDLANQSPVEVVEPALPRPVFGLRMAEMPFSDQCCFVPCLFEGFWQQPLVGSKSVLTARRDDRRLQPITQGIAPGQECCPRRRAHWLNIELVELDSGFGEPIDVWCLDVGPMKADVFPAQIVRNDVNDVGRHRTLSRCRNAQGQSDGGRKPCSQQ